MRVLLQRVSRASVTVADEVTGAIGTGFVALVGVTHDDAASDAAFLAGKVANLRVFPDAAGAMNRSLLEVLEGEDDHPTPSANGETERAALPVGVLAISQFTLYADVRKGRRPSFVAAARPEHAAPLVDAFVAALRALGVPVATGRFGAHMDVDLVNDGPVTLWLDTAEL